MEKKVKLIGNVGAWHHRSQRKDLVWKILSSWLHVSAQSAGVQSIVLSCSYRWKVAGNNSLFLSHVHERFTKSFALLWGRSAWMQYGYWFLAGNVQMTTSGGSCSTTTRLDSITTMLVIRRQYGIDPTTVISFLWQSSGEENAKYWYTLLEGWKAKSWYTLWKDWKPPFNGFRAMKLCNTNFMILSAAASYMIHTNGWLWILVLFCRFWSKTQKWEERRRRQSIQCARNQLLLRLLLIHFLYGHLVGLLFNYVICLCIVL